MTSSNPRYILVTTGVALTVSGSIIAALWPGSDGKTAILIILVNASLLAVYFSKIRDPAMARLLLFGLVFGTVELVADALCVQITKTLDYTPAGSVMIWESPWWMPLAWTFVALQTGYLGALALDRWGWRKGLAQAMIIGAIQIPFYEELAYYAGWWRYMDCRMIGHTPLYIIIAEALIVAGIAPMARIILRESSNAKFAALLGALAGLWSILAGIFGYGIAEFIPNGFRLP